nr:retrovirus-related Pol polyprotein from transposon TNT 1-94 [Tanacetum cinerariifolium]
MVFKCFEKWNDFIEIAFLGVLRGYIINALIGLEAGVCSFRASAFILMRSLDQNIYSGVNCVCGQARQIKCYNYNGISHITRNCTQPKRPQNSEYFKDKMLLMKAQENEVALYEEQLLFIAGGQDNAVDEDVDEQPVQDLALNVDNLF